MGRNLIQMVRQDKDPKSRNLAIKELKSYVKDLDPNSIPIFLAQLSDTKEATVTSGEHTISLYEDIARIHGPIIVPHIDNIMLTIIKTLTSNSDSLTLHQACSKAVSAIARYGLDPITPDVKKQEIMHSICKPLSDSLLARENCLSSGAALCLTEIVELDYWRFCSSQMVHEVCQRVAAGLEKPMQGDSHMGLVMALAKRNGLVVEGYARLLVRAGVRILNAGVTEEDVQKRLLAIRMVNCLMMSLNCKFVMSELSFVIEEFQKFQHDEIVDVKEAAFEGIQMAKRILWSNVDVSLKDGLFSGKVSTSSGVKTRTREDYEDGFSGFFRRSLINGDPRSRTASPQRSRPYVNTDNINHFTSPSKLVKSLHGPDSRNQRRRFRSPPSRKFNWISNIKRDQNGFNEGFTNEDGQFNGASEIMSATEDIPTNGSTNMQQCQEPVPETQVKFQMLFAVSIYFGLFVLLAAVVCYWWICDINKSYNVVPT